MERSCSASTSGAPTVSGDRVRRNVFGLNNDTVELEYDAPCSRRISNHGQFVLEIEYRPVCKRGDVIAIANADDIEPI